MFANLESNRLAPKHEADIMTNIKKLCAGFITLAIILGTLTGCTGDSGDDNSDVIAAEIAIEYDDDGNFVAETMQNYKFIHDDILGKWNIIDVISNIEEFNPNKINGVPDDVIWQSVEFFEDGDAELIYSDNYGIFRSTVDKRLSYILAQRFKLCSKNDR